MNVPMSVLCEEYGTARFEIRLGIQCYFESALTNNLEIAAFKERQCVLLYFLCLT